MIVMLFARRFGTSNTNSWLLLVFVMISKLYAECSRIKPSPLVAVDTTPDLSVSPNLVRCPEELLEVWYALHAFTVKDNNR